MASKTRHIFTRSKPLLNIYSGLDHEGKQVEVREDAEQLVKWHEIVDALVAAGYYRAALTGLSSFDKIVGGLAWCIELCDIDVDVNLLFEENLTIGKKIALTEKIVKVLPSMKCPYTIEPHQIQGSDFRNIFPLVQWLVKYSGEFREARESELRNFAVSQYDKNHIFELDRAEFERKDKLLKNIATVQSLYGARRVRRRAGALGGDALAQATATLAEYGARLLQGAGAAAAEGADGDGMDFLYDYEKALADPSEITTEVSPAHTYDEPAPVDNSLHYALLHSAVSGEVSEQLEEAEKAKYSREIDQLTRNIESMQSEAQDSKARHAERMAAAESHRSRVADKLQKITARLMMCEDYTAAQVRERLQSLRSLGRERAELRAHAAAAARDHAAARDLLSALSSCEPERPLTAEQRAQFGARRAALAAAAGAARAAAARVTRDLLRWARALDDAPGPAELLQYERRFVELYSQVASKHKETKQYYIFFNTLYEVKLYTSKELSLLNSILDNYDEAMSSQRKRDEFMRQFESIVEWVNNTVRAVEAKRAAEAARRAQLGEEWARLLDSRRRLAAALALLAAARRARET